MIRVDVPTQRPSDSGGRCVVCEAALEGARCQECGAAQAPGGYTVLRELSRSTHGRVSLARAPDGSRVALKELVFALAPDARQIDAFEREAATLASLGHPGIPRFVASFREGSGVGLRLYVAQQFVEGESLEQRLARGPLEEGEAGLLAGELLGILRALHQRHPPCVHRDIKPANVLLTPEGGVRLVDFGAARELVFGQTHGATLVGTFGYMAPEQLGGTVSPASDLYALGATLLHALCGIPPAELLREDALSVALDRAPNVPERWRPFLARLLARRPSARFGSAQEALTALPGSTRAVLRFRQRSAWIAAAVALLAVIAVGAFDGRLGAGASRQTPPAGAERTAPAAGRDPEQELAKLFQRLADAQTHDEKYAVLQELRYGPGAGQPRLESQEAQLAALLSEPAEDLRVLALRLLATRPLLTPARVELIADLLGADRSATVQSAAAEALGKLLDQGLPEGQRPAVAQALLTALERSADPAVWSLAGNALQRVHPLPPETLRRLEGLVHGQLKGRSELALAVLLGHLAQLPADDAAALRLLDSDSEQARHLGVALLSRGRLPGPVVDRLAAFARGEPRLEARLDALRVLADAPGLGDSQAARELLVHSLSDPLAPVRLEAARTLASNPPLLARLRPAVEAARARETAAENRVVLDALLSARAPEPGGGEER